MKKLLLALMIGLMGMPALATTEDAANDDLNLSAAESDESAIDTNNTDRQWGRRYVCYARNSRGRYFRGDSNSYSFWGRRQASSEALRRCRYSSWGYNRCYLVSCRTQWGW